MARDYGQYCALARAVEVVGERWTPLIVRELFAGPKRFSDLVNGLPGIGSAVLAGRLKRLEAEGVVRRGYLPPPADRDVYELTDDGRELGAALVPLALWGARRLGRRRRGETFRIEWFLLLLNHLLDGLGPVDLDETFELHLDGEVCHLRVEDGRVRGHEGPARGGTAVVVVRSRIETFAAIGTGRLDPGSALADGRISVDGDVGSFRRLLAILGAAVLRERVGG